MWNSWQRAANDRLRRCFGGSRQVRRSISSSCALCRSYHSSGLRNFCSRSFDIDSRRPANGIGAIAWPKLAKREFASEGWWAARGSNPGHPD